jgi:hypothetical protein
MALAGIEVITCEVEVDVTAHGFGAPTLVGLPDSGVTRGMAVGQPESQLDAGSAARRMPRC